MAVQTSSPAVEIATAHIRAWANHDMQGARAALADDVAVSVTTTGPFPPPVNTIGTEDYMVGLEAFTQAVLTGSDKEVAAIGDDRNALILVTVEADFGFGKTTLPGARLYLVNDENKIAAEQVIFFAAS
jgi:hypothetical protein